MGQALSRRSPAKATGIALVHARTTPIQNREQEEGTNANHNHTKRKNMMEREKDLTKAAGTGEKENRVDETKTTPGRTSRQRDGGLVFSAADIVKRAKLMLNQKTDAQLAAYLGVSRSTLCNWVARNSIDFPLVLGKLGGVDYNWLLTGKGTPYHQPRPCQGGVAGGEAELVHRSKTREPMEERSVTLYDLAASANLKTLMEQGEQYRLGKIVIPSIPPCDGAIYVNGDSMYPILKSGDIVGFKFIRSFMDVIYGEMYIVSFTLGGDEYLVVKYVNRSEQPGCIRLVSYNTHHDPMDLPLQNINAMAIVKFSIRKNMMM